MFDHKLQVAKYKKETSSHLQPKDQKTKKDLGSYFYGARA